MYAWRRSLSFRLFAAPTPISTASSGGKLSLCNSQVACVIALPQRGQSVEEEAQLVPQLEQVEQLVQPFTFETLAEHAPLHVPQVPVLFEQELQYGFPPV